MLAKTRNLLVWSIAGAATVSGLGLASCNGGTSTSRPVPVVFGDVIPLTAADVVTIVNRALT